MILQSAIIVSYIAIGSALLLTAWRLWQGPGLPDRIMSLDKLYINTVALLVVLGIDLDSNVFFEVALLIALMGFIGTIAACKYITNGDIVS